MARIVLVFGFPYFTTSANVTRLLARVIVRDSFDK